MSIFSDVDSMLESARQYANTAEMVARIHLPVGTEVLFQFGNMVNWAPGRVQFVTEFGGDISVQVENLVTGGRRRIPLDAIKQVEARE